MRILVLSDSHGKLFNVIEAVEAQNDAEVVVFLGDGEDDINFSDFAYRNKRVFKIRGNCDYSSLLPYDECAVFDNIKILMTHGHLLSVKMGMDDLEAVAKEKQVQIALYGHTHNPKIDYVDGVYYMNPGTVGARFGEDATYGTIDITKAGIFCNIVPLKRNTNK